MDPGPVNPPAEPAAAVPVRVMTTVMAIRYAPDDKAGPSLPPPRRALSVRRIRPARQQLISAAANGSPALIGLYCFLEAVTGSEGLVAYATGEPLAFGLQRHPALGLIASEDVYDAVSAMEPGHAQRVVNFATADPLDPVTLGN
jgi:hypothetical protein